MKCIDNFFVFNFSKNRKVLSAESIGHDLGLIVILNTSSDDYFYTTKNFKGFVIQIFNSADYPDITTGSVYEQIIDAKKEIFMRLGVLTLMSEDSIKAYSTSQRGCLFETENNAEYNGHYSLSQCFIKCKLRSIIALCKCIPFQYPTLFVGESVHKCSFTEIECLNRYNGKMIILIF